MQHVEAVHVGLARGPLAAERGIDGRVDPLLEGVRGRGWAAEQFANWLIDAWTRLLLRAP